ncbi:MAG: tyrosine-type recombinase/integrase [Candidatus Eisenbacteria bacterium]
MRLATAIRCFDIQLAADGKSEHTRGAYLRDLTKFRDWLRGDPDIVSIAPGTLARYLTRKAPVTIPAISGNRTKTALRVFFRFLVAAGYMDTDPARLIKNGRTEPKIPAHLTAAEARRLMSAIRVARSNAADRDRALFAFLLYTGIRLGSAIELRVRDVNLGQRTAQINGKGGARQSVYLNSSVRRFLKSHIKAFGLTPDDALFPSRSGGHLCARQVQLRFKHWLDKAGITRHLTVHSTRHTFAMNLYRSSGNLRLVQTALGHRHISTTEIYARVEDKTLRRALERL